MTDTDRILILLKAAAELALEQCADRLDDLGVERTDPAAPFGLEAFKRPAYHHALLPLETFIETLSQLTKESQIAAT